MIRDDLAALVVDTMAEGVCLVSVTDATIVYANPRFEAMLGYGPGELDGQPVTTVNYEREPGAAEEVARSIIAQLEATGEAVYEILNRRKDGTAVWCRSRTTSFCHPEYSDVWVAVHTIIEPEKQLQDAIRARDEVLAVVAHDLRGPLNNIGLRASALTHDLGELAPLGSARRNWLEGIQRAVEEMSRQIEDLLDVARLERGALALERGEFDVAALLSEAVERVAPHAADRRLRTECEDPLPALVGDRRRMLQVLDNLLGNALKFTRSGDEITVGAARGGDHLRLWVADTGPGISPDHLSRVFERAWQASPTDRRGAGLGLAIVHDIVEAHGGHTWATSKPGHGATFHVSLPLAKTG